MVTNILKCETLLLCQCLLIFKLMRILENVMEDVVIFLCSASPHKCGLFFETLRGYCERRGTEKNIIQLCSN